ncbi:uncharacterized protein LOC105889602 isoform X5 [Clupea harengus]|uniref:Uncharacterized protein LOC105889602 isoform X5 n=1 Tax=Clupea harengus TaxID=7950 RepID=A0A6P8GT81_CLUHA|nr:uncharacterized protein LOC105889602 isoform X5 [Clupea harengus]XP_031438687.1 uncharacterized protein LOC105889602 isoform X5 [Clupea harengus]
MKQQVWIIFFLAVPLCSSVQVDNATVNGDVTLSPVGISTVRSVVWKFEIDKVAEFDPSFSEEVKIFGNYRGRTTLDKETGSITISKLTLEDSGTFSVEVDSVLMPDSYRLEVHVPVPWVQIVAGILASIGVIGIGAVGWRLYQNRESKTDDDKAGNGSGLGSNKDTDDQNGESGGLVGKSTV